jgi:WD40 repeat protein/uncharacterized caspase-like protein
MIMRHAFEWMGSFLLTTISGFVALLVTIPCDETLAAEESSTLRAEIVQQTGHTSSVNAVAFSRDGKFVLSGGGSITDNENVLKLWDAASGQLIRTFTGHSRPVKSIAFSPDGLTILSGSDDTTWKLWDLASGRDLKTFSGHESGVAAIAISPDGKMAASGSYDRTIKLWDIASGEEVRSFKGHTLPVLAVAFSSNGNSILSGSYDKTLKLWNTDSSKAVRTLKGHKGGIYAVAFSPDGSQALSGSQDATMRLWDIKSGKSIRTFKGHSGQVQSVAFSPDARLALSASGSIFKSAGSIEEVDDNVRLWDIATGSQIRGFKGHVNKYGSGKELASVTSIAFSHDGKIALSGSYDQSLKLWNVATGALIRSLEGSSALNNNINSAKFSRNGKLALLASDDTTLKLWNFSGSNEIQLFKGHSKPVRSAVFTADDKHAVSAGDDNTTKLWDIAGGKQVRTLAEFGGPAVLSPDGMSVLSSVGEALTLWSLGSGNQIQTFNASKTKKDQVSGFASFAFSPDGKLVLAGGYGKKLRLFEVASGREIRAFKGHDTVFNHGISSISFSPDGKQALTTSTTMSVENSKVAILWEIDTGREIRSFQGHKAGVLSGAFSPDGRMVITGSDDHTLKLWNAMSGEEIRTFSGHSAEVRSVAFSPDGKLILSAGGHGRTALWDAATGTLLATLFSLEDGDNLTLTPEGFFDASPRASRLLTLVHGLEVYSIDQVYDQLYRPDLVREKLAGDLNGLVKEAAAKINLDIAIGSGAPPRVTFVDPPSLVHDFRATIAVDVSDEGGGIGKVEWRVNGVTIGLEDRGLARVDPSPGERRRVVKDLFLSPGDNIVEVVAYNAKGLVTSQPARISIISDAKASAKSRKLFVMAVGVNDYYDSRLMLNYAVPDAQAIVANLSEGGKDLFGEVVTKLVTDADVTVDGLEAAFNDISERASPQDTFILFVAGHGKTIDGRYYFVPQDFRYRDSSSFAHAAIGQDRFQNWLSKISAQRSVLLFDTCESGSLTQDQPEIRGLERAVAMEKMTAAMGRTTIAASTDTTPALEGYKGHGVFTYAILEGLSGADGNSSGDIDVLEMISYLDRTVPVLSNEAFKRRQIPQAKFSGSNFVFTRQSSLRPQDNAKSEALTGRPASSTHVVLSSSDARAEPDGGETLARLQAGMTVSVLRSERGWVLVAKDGKQIGFIPQDAIAQMQ